MNLTEWKRLAEAAGPEGVLSNAGVAYYTASHPARILAALT